MKKMPLRDPEGASVRRSIASRRRGQRRCSICGESRSEALVRRRTPTDCAECVRAGRTVTYTDLCAGCDRKLSGKTDIDEHHPAGAANHPATIPVPVNDHRADLSPAQEDWSKETRENPRGSPLLAASGCIRGFMDTVVYLIKSLLGWIPECLEQVDVMLTRHYGPHWWRGWNLPMPTR
jgi:hypothetical protein